MEAVGADVMWEQIWTGCVWLDSAAELELAHVLCYHRMPFSVYVTLFKE